MAALDFPTSPTTNQTYTANGSTWTYNGVSWVGSNPMVSALVYDNFNATAGQTTFTTSKTYTSGKIEVYLNGALMLNGTDVTVTSGTSVVFATGVTLNDDVTLVYPI